MLLEGGECSYADDGCLMQESTGIGEKNDHVCHGRTKSIGVINLNRHARSSGAWKAVLRQTKIR